MANLNADYAAISQGATQACGAFALAVALASMGGSSKQQRIGEDMIDISDPDTLEVAARTLYKYTGILSEGYNSLSEMASIARKFLTDSNVKIFCSDDKIIDLFGKKYPEELKRCKDNIINSKFEKQGEEEKDPKIKIMCVMTPEINLHWVAIDNVNIYDPRYTDISKLYFDGQSIRSANEQITYTFTGLWIELSDPATPLPSVTETSSSAAASAEMTDN